jgi:hypothetical protein
MTKAQMFDLFTFSCFASFLSQKASSSHSAKKVFTAIGSVFGKVLVADRTPKPLQLIHRRQPVAEVPIHDNHVGRISSGTLSDGERATDNPPLLAKDPEKDKLSISESVRPQTHTVFV